MKLWRNKAAAFLTLSTIAIVLTGCFSVINNPPTIAGSPALAVTIGNDYTFTPEATDPDGNNLTFSIENLPTWASFDEETGTVSATAVPGPATMYTDIVITVHDGSLSASLPPFSVEVTSVPLASATVTWTRPTKNEDGSDLDDLVAFKVYYGTSEGSYPNWTRVDDAAAVQAVIDDLSAEDNTYFVVTAINSKEAESVYSNMATRTGTAPNVSNQASLAGNQTHPMVYLNQTQLDALRAHVKSGADDHVTRAYNKMKTYGDSKLNDSPVMQGPSDDWLPNYKEGLIDTEKATAWAVCYHVEDDITYAQKARDFVMHYRNTASSHLLSWVSWEINIMIIYDLTVSSGVYSSGDIASMESYLLSNTDVGWAEADPGWKENMSHWITGTACIASLMLGDQAKIDRAYAQWTRRIDATEADGRFFDFDHRGNDGLGYNVYSLSPMLIAAQAAKHTGRDWWGYSSNGRSLSNSVDFLTTSASDKPGANWIPSMYGNGINTGENGQTTGDYAATLSPGELSDQRFLFELAQDNRPKTIYENILNDSSNGHNRREDLYNYHVHYWLGAFLNIGTTPPGPTPTRPRAPTDVTASSD